MSISASGNKLQPYIIFKGQKNKILYQELQQFNELKENKIFLSTQENAWLDENLFIDYLKKVIVPYMPNKKKLLILDYCPAHYTEETLNFMEKKSVILIYIVFISSTSNTQFLS